MQVQGRMERSLEREVVLIEMFNQAAPRGSHKQPQGVIIARLHLVRQEASNAEAHDTMLQAAKQDAAGQPTWQAPDELPMWHRFVHLPQLQPASTDQAASQSKQATAVAGRL